VREPGAPADPPDAADPASATAPQADVAARGPEPPADIMSDRLERDLSLLGSLAAATGEARSKATLAQRALDTVMSTTGADHGSIVMADGAVGSMVAVKNVPPALEHIAGDVGWADSPAIRALTPIGNVVRGSIDRLPLDPVTRRELIDAGIRSLLLVGLHREDELIGVLSLAWGRDDMPLPSEALAKLAATTIARGLENARLAEEIVRRNDATRTSSDRSRKIDELARAGSSVRSLEELVDRSSRLINKALGASGTIYALLAPEGVSYGPSSFVATRPAVERWLRTHRPDLSSSFLRWRAGEGAYLGALEPGLFSATEVDVAREAGILTYAVMPIRDGEDVVGGVAAYFDRPLPELHVDRGDLERVASIASLTLENFWLRERVTGADERFRALFAGSHHPMLLALQDGTLVDANDAALRLFGSEREWLLGRRLEEVAVYDFEQITTRLSGMRVGESFAGSATAIRRDGRRVPVEVETTLVLVEGERRFLAWIDDLTDQERLQRELVAAQKMEVAGRLAPGVAHELSNPLAAIVGFSQIIRANPSLPEDLRHNAELLVAEAARTQDIAGNFLDFLTHRPPERRSTSIRALIDSVLTLQASSLGAGTIEVEVEVEVPDDLPPVELDRGQMQQVLVNLTRNAIEAVGRGAGRRIGVNAVREGRSGPDERVRVTVADDGRGVPPEHVDRLFEAFFSTKPPREGSGLGLSVSRAIVRSHGGDLRFAPPPDGRGAAFTFDLPVRAASKEGDDAWPVPGPAGGGTTTARPAGGEVAATAAPAAGSAAAAPTAAPGGRVLVLDDDPSFRAFLESALAALGYEPVIAARGQEAVGLARDGDPAAILCDHQMVGMSGIEVYEAVVGNRPDLAARFVMMSGDVLDPALEAFAATHEMTRLAKPFDLATLDRTLRGVMSEGDQSRG
jgi:PAS domain S-box-containing protein